MKYDNILPNTGKYKIFQISFYVEKNRQKM